MLKKEKTNHQTNVYSRQKICDNFENNSFQMELLFYRVAARGGMDAFLLFIFISCI